jgi:hypothetical protein
LLTVNSRQWGYWCWSRLQLAYYFHELEIADKLVKPYLKLAKQDTFFAVQTVRVFFSGLVASGLMKKTGKRKYKKRAKKELDEMKALMQSRGLNNLHRYLLMVADYAACKQKDSDEVKRSFDKAIAAAGKAGFTQDAALGNELAGEYFLSLGDDDFWTKHYFSRAHELYHEWGAQAKVDHLFSTRGEYIDTATTMHKSTMKSSVPQGVFGQDSKIHRAVNLDLLSATSRSSITDLATSVADRSHISGFFSTTHENSSRSVTDFSTRSTTDAGK